MKNERRGWLEKERDRLREVWRSFDEARYDAEVQARAAKEQAENAYRAYSGLKEYLDNYYPKGS